MQTTWTTADKTLSARVIIYRKCAAVVANIPWDIMTGELFFTYRVWCKPHLGGTVLHVPCMVQAASWGNCSSRTVFGASRILGELFFTYRVWCKPHLGSHFVTLRSFLLGCSVNFCGASAYATLCRLSIYRFPVSIVLFQDP
jgi:hypothetical protein